VEAAVTGDRVAARKALLANPLVGDYRVVGPLLEALLEASRPWLPRFFPGP
jgi:alpha-galactosidase/6-phospho-beta-glucosidase family protein